jgi:hypothetical protein
MLGPLGRGLALGLGLLTLSFYVYPDYPLLSLGLVLLSMVVGFWLRKPLLQEPFLKKNIPEYLQQIVTNDSSIRQKILRSKERRFAVDLDRFELKFSYASGLPEKSLLEDKNLSLMMLDVVDRRSGFTLCRFQPSPNPQTRHGDFHPQTFADDILVTTMEGELRGYLERLKKLDESPVI